jgi:Clr5 domain
VAWLVHGAGRVLASPRTAASSALLNSIFHTDDPLPSLKNCYCHFIPTIAVHQIVTMQQSWKVTKASRSSIRNKSRLVAPEAMPRAPCRARSDQKWSRYKEEIRSFYINQDKTLEDTMQMIDLPASERKWKQQLKEWGFQKNLPASHMAILVAKREQGLRDYGKKHRLSSKRCRDQGREV